MKNENERGKRESGWGGIVATNCHQNTDSPKVSIIVRKLKQISPLTFLPSFLRECGEFEGVCRGGEKGECYVSQPEQHLSRQHSSW